jgi:hypothetical protein
MVYVKPPIIIESTMEKEFSTFEVMKILDIKRERLREWMNNKFISPTQPASGVGTKAIFSILDVYKTGVFKKLVESGINRRKASVWLNTNPGINNYDEAEKINFIIVFDSEKGGKWISYKGLPPWTMEVDVWEFSDWNVGVLINFRKLREEIKSSMSNG